MIRSILYVPLVVLCFLLPLTFLPLTSEIVETPKQLLLVFLVAVSALVWFGFNLKKESVTLRRGYLNLLPIFFLLSVFISCLLSGGGFISWIGQQSQEYTSFLTTAAFVVLFYVLVHVPRSPLWQQRFIRALIFSATIVAFLFALQLIGVPLGDSVGVSSRLFNPIGGATAAAIFLISVSILANMQYLAKKGRRFDSFFTFLLSLFTLFILLALDSFLLWILFLVGLVTIFLFVIGKPTLFSTNTRFLLPTSLFVCALVFLFSPSLLHLPIPPEVAPTLGTSWQIASSSVSDDSVFFGTGPGTFRMDYGKFFPVELNATPFWDVRFDRSSSHLLTLLATIGIVGVAIHIVFIIWIGTLAMRAPVTVLPVFPAWVVLVVAQVLAESNLTLTFLFWVFSGLLAQLLLKKTRTITWRASARRCLGFSFAHLLLAIAMATGLFVTVQRYTVEMVYAQGLHLSRSGVEMGQVIKKLTTAAQFNRLSDMYQRDLAYAYLLAANEELRALAEPEMRPALQQFIAGAVSAAMRSTELAPKNALNWELFGTIYLEISAVVEGASQQAVDAFGRAHELEPNNPVYWTHIGRAHLSFTDDVPTHLRSAEEALNAAIALKTDYSPAHYYLVFVYDRLGNLAGAVTKMEAVKQHNPLDVGVAYQLAALYLRQGNRDAAKAELERALSITPAYADAGWLLATLYEEEGNIQAAIEQVSLVLENDPENLMVQERLTQLEAQLERLLTGQISTGVPEAIEE